MPMTIGKGQWVYDYSRKREPIKNGNHQGRRDVFWSFCGSCFYFYSGQLKY